MRLHLSKRQKITGSASLSLADGDNYLYSGRFTHRYDIVDLYYYYESGRTKYVDLNNL
ncbi:hypothetical protein J0801_28735 [Bacillus cereus]|uniref:hypothetical protein n=1 Tax=Bacillus cereus TaxID=1396 RepID=UPI002FDC0CA0